MSKRPRLLKEEDFKLFLPETPPALLEGDEYATQPQGAQEVSPFEPDSQSTITDTQDAETLTHTPEIAPLEDPPHPLGRHSTTITQKQEEIAIKPEALGRSSSFGRISGELQREQDEWGATDMDDLLFAEFSGRYQEAAVFSRQAFTLYDTFDDGPAAEKGDEEGKTAGASGAVPGAILAAAQGEVDAAAGRDISEQLREAEEREPQVLTKSARVTEDVLQEKDVLLDMEVRAKRVPHFAHSRLR